MDYATGLGLAAGAVVLCVLIMLGGDLRMFGEHDWQIQLRDADNVVRHLLTARDCAIASSANLLDRRSVRGQLLAPHIGRNGAPVLTDRRVSVIAERCIIADAITKVAMVDARLTNQLLLPHGGYVLPETCMAGAA